MGTPEQPSWAILAHLPRLVIARSPKEPAQTHLGTNRCINGLGFTLAQEREDQPAA